jgi:hypothetical protein
MPNANITRGRTQQAPFDTANGNYNEIDVSIDVQTDAQ